MSISEMQPPPSLGDDESAPDPGLPSEVNLESVIMSWLHVHPTPSDEQVHAFARSIGMDYKLFEAKVYEMLSAIVTQTSDEESEDLLEPRDPLDTFLLTFFMFNKEPSDDQVHALAELLGMPHEELEERVYRMLAEVTEETAGDGTGLESVNWEGSPETAPLI